jgi:hypothetical protein
LERYCARWIAQLERALAGAVQSDRPEAQARAAALQDEIRMLKEVAAHA